MLAPLQYAERSRRRTVLIAAAVIAVIAALCAVLLTRGSVATVLVSAGPPYPVDAGTGPGPELLPEQDGPHDGQVWMPWTLLAVSSDGRAVTVGWTNAGTQCGVSPVAVEVKQENHTTQIGLISPAGTGGLCASSGMFRTYRIPLAEPASRAIFRLGA